MAQQIDLDLESFRQWLSSQPAGTHWFWQGQVPFQGQTPITSFIQSHVLREYPIGTREVVTIPSQGWGRQADAVYDLASIRERNGGQKAFAAPTYGPWQRYRLPEWAILLHDKLVQSFACSQPRSEQECKLEQVLLLLSEVESSLK